MIDVRVHFSSQTDQWATPTDVFTTLSHKYGPFDVDVCAIADNAKCPRYFSPEQNGLLQPWEGRCWCNPPYGRTIGLWVRKAWESSLSGATVVCLLPARTDTRWWHDYVARYGKVEFLRGRIRFGGGKHAAPFPSAVVVFEPARQYHCRWCGRLFVPQRTDAKFCSAACKQAGHRARRVTAISVTSNTATWNEADQTNQLTN